MVHELRKDSQGDYIIVGETDAYPYCMYIECARCGLWFCGNGCDDMPWRQQCAERQLALFDVDYYTKTRYQESL